MSMLIERAMAAHEAGYEVVACHGKAPVFPGWQHGGATPDKIKGWEADTRITNIGVLTGTILGLDIDIADAGLSERAKNLALQILGNTTLVRIGREPRQLMVYRAATPMRKRIATGVLNGTTHKVEVLGLGQQFVAYGRHPDTLQPYVWPEDDLTSIPASMVPEVTEEALGRYLAALVDVIGPPLRPAPAPSPRTTVHVNGHRDEPIDPAEAIDALNAIPGDLDYDEWIRVGFALYAALGSGGYAHWCAWSAKSTKNVPATTSKKWHTFAGARDIHAETLFWIAQEHGWKPARTEGPRTEDLGIFKARPSRFEPRFEPRFDPETGEILEEVTEPATSSATEVSGALATIDPFPFDPSKIPRRDWLVPNLLLRGHLSLLVAPPGTGKSLLSLQATIMLATGKQWGGWTPRKPAKSLIISIEDDLDEMRRRIWAACEVMDIDPAALAGKIRMVSHAEDVIIMRRGRRTGEIIATDLEARIALTRKQWEFDNLVVDPLSETHEVTENSNDEVKAVAAAWRGVGRRVGLSVLAIHHTPKNASSMAGSLDAARGGGALGAIARIGATLFDMSDEEADALGIDRKDRRDYAGYDDAKVSYGKLIAKKWFVKQSVILPNHGLGIEGDSVGAFVPWEAPNAFDALTSANLREVQNTIAGGRWRFSPQAANWVGKAVADTLGLDIEADAARIKKLLKVWIKNGSLVVAHENDEKSNKRPFVVVGEWVKYEDIA